MMSSEMCKKCFHHTVCMRDKNTVGDVFVAGHPNYFDNKKLFEQFKEREKAGFPCDTFCGWIPCSERLPDAQTEVIVSCIDDSGDTRFLYTSSGWVTTNGEYWIVDNEINSFVIAWMPLPEPYREDGEANEDD